MLAVAEKLPPYAIRLLKGKRKKDKRVDVLQVLWVDLRSVQEQVSSYHYLNEEWTVSRVSRIDKIDQKMGENPPRVVCFEFDYPDISRLSALRQVRCLFPSTPVIMLTKQHSEALAVWALRVQVWDYLVKPFQPQELVTSIATLLATDELSKNKTPQSPQCANLLSNPFPPEVRIQTAQLKKTYPAELFVETHYHEKIYEEEVAQLCGLNAGTFSRYFKKEHKVTFRGYLINYRIFKARELLENPNVMVTDIAYTVGFNDPSYFTRMFRRIVGVSPSRYHQAHKVTS